MGDKLVFFFLLVAFLFVLGEEGDKAKLQVNIKTFIKTNKQSSLDLNKNNQKITHDAEGEGRKGWQLGKNFLSKRNKTKQTSANRVIN